MTVVLKIPYDASIVESHRRGASKGPDALQKELGERGVWKDVEIDEGDFANTLEIIRKTAKKEYDKNNFVIGLGGDHSISYGLVKAFLEKHPKGGLIVFDAHFDCMDNFYPPTHEDWLRVLIEKDKFSQILLLGARKSHKIEREFAKSVKLYVKEPKLEAIKDFIKDFKEIYVSIDIDVLDSKYAPGTGWPEKGGISPEKAKKLLEFLKKSGKVKGMDLVEFSPPRDVNNITNKVAVSLLSGFF
ncbi:MAG: arginase family protein [Nanoarchaeota archaeon]